MSVTSGNDIPKLAAKYSMTVLEIPVAVVFAVQIAFVSIRYQSVTRTTFLFPAFVFNKKPSMPIATNSRQTAVENICCLPILLFIRCFHVRDKHPPTVVYKLLALYRMWECCCTVWYICRSPGDTTTKKDYHRWRMHSCHIVAIYCCNLPSI